MFPSAARNDSYAEEWGSPAAMHHDDATLCNSAFIMQQKVTTCTDASSAAEGKVLQQCIVMRQKVKVLHQCIFCSKGNILQRRIGLQHREFPFV